MPMTYDELLKENKELGERIEKLEDMGQFYKTEWEHGKYKVQNLEAHNLSYRSALEKYGDHSIDCADNFSENHMGCTCGFEQFLHEDGMKNT